MKIPTLEELIEVSKKFRLEDLSDEDQILLEKQIGDFTFKIWCEIDTEEKSLYCYSTAMILNDEQYDLEDGQNFDEDFSSFEDFIEQQLDSGREKVKDFQKIVKMLNDIEDFANSKNLDLKIVRNIADEQIHGWY